MDHTRKSAPEWLNNIFLETALRSYKRDETIEVLTFDVRSEFSDHFASTIFQSKIEFKSRKYLKSESEVINVVIKAEPIEDGLKSTIACGTPLFKTEIRMYKETLPGIHQLFERSGLKIEFSPELIYATEEPFSIIILKDLTVDGFNAPRQPPDHLDDAKLIIQRIAQFHAASFYLAETNQYDFTQYDYTIYKNEAAIQGFFLEFLTTFKEVLETWEGYQEFIPKIDFMIENVGTIGRKSYTANKPGFGYNVLNHGDFYMRNMLLKFNDINRIENFFFIDYQLSVYCSPCVDVSYMFQIVNRDEDGEIPMNDLIMMYHENFVKTLRAFGYKSSPPSLLDLNIELLKHGAMNMLMMITFLPFLFVDMSKLKVEDMVAKDGEDSKNFKRKIYEHPMVKKILQREMKQWAYNGWF